MKYYVRFLDNWLRPFEITDAFQTKAEAERFLSEANELYDCNLELVEVEED